MATATERIQQQVGELGEWFHNFDLAGVRTAPHHQLGDYPRSKWRHISPALPERMEGLSILDIGCNAAFHALECKRRGASQVLGIDADARYLAQARLAAEVLKLDIDLRQMSVYALGELDQQFDYVLFMGLFYHLRYPLYALDLVVKKVRQRLIFQTMLRGEPGDDNEVKPDYTFWDATPFQQPGFPRMYFIERSFAGDATNWWIPNRAAAEAMLRTAGLEIVAHPEEETWICAPRPAPEGFVHDRELAATL
jgi:tRNA (mo5U34)-methyltransferase